MIIVVEGPNNVGKSTFINKLVTESDCFKEYDIEHVSSKCPNDYTFHEVILNNYDNLILDRFYVGETIYPIIYNRPGKLTVEDIPKLIEHCGKKVVTVFIDADIEFIANAYQNKNENPNWEEIYNERIMFNKRYEYLYKNTELCMKIYHRLGEYYDNDISDEDAIALLDLLAKQDKKE